MQASWILPYTGFNAKTFPALHTMTIVFDESNPLLLKDTFPLLMLSRQTDKLRFAVNAEIGASTDIVSWMRRTSLQEVHRQSEHFKCVSGVVLLINGPLEWEHEPSEEVVRSVAEGWFGQFPALRRAGIWSTAENLGREIARVEKFCMQALPAVIENLETFEVNGVAYSLPAEEGRRLAMMPPRLT